MPLKWSHAVLNVRDEAKMLEFYTRVLGFSVSDRGPLGDNAPEIIFMSQDKNEHHQLAIVVARKDQERPNSLNHLAFRVDGFAEIKALKDKLEVAHTQFMPLSHGNTLSLYFADPEHNGIEVFWDTPWHVAQPAGIQWDPDLNEAQALAWVEATFKDSPSFSKRDTAQGDFVSRPSA